MTKRFESICRSSNKINEYRDCTVKALAIAGRISYYKAHEIMSSLGRKNRRGIPFRDVHHQAFELAGCRLEEVTNSDGTPLRQPNGSKYTPKTIGKKLKSGYYIAYVKGHVFAVINGQVEDWTDNRNHRILDVYKVTVPRGSRR